MLRKGVLIIGASKGIGLATARKFAREGYDIVATFNSTNEQNLKNLENEFSVKVQTFKLNLENADKISSVVQQAFASHDFIDAVVCCAGSSIGEKLLCSTELKEIERVLNVNLKATILVCREAIKQFLPLRRGNIVTVSSIYGIYGGSCEVVYSSSKAGIIGLTKSLAQEVGQAGIRINTVAPGFIETDMTADFNDEEREAVIRKTPLHRIGIPNDVANAIYFLAGEQSSFVTGQVLEVAGGATTFA